VPPFSKIEFGPVPPFSKIEFGPVPPFSKIEFGPTPTISVNWGTTPTLSCVIKLECPTSGSPMAALDADPYADPNIDIDLGDIGIPSIIKVIDPVIPDIKILHDIPGIIKVESIKIPSIIKMISDLYIPSEIRIRSEDIPSEIRVISHNLPSIISIDASNIPNFIRLEVPNDFPRTIRIDASQIPDKIQVVGIPPQIELVGSIPSEIRLVMPDKPEIEMVYKGSPIDVKIQLDISKLNGDSQKGQCVAIVPCE
jgi:hypothetical protein